MTIPDNPRFASEASTTTGDLLMPTYDSKPGYHNSKKSMGDKPKKKTTAEDVPGSGMAKKAGKAIESRKKRMKKMMDEY